MESFTFQPGESFNYTIHPFPKEDDTISFSIDLETRKGEIIIIESGNVINFEGREDEVFRSLNFFRPGQAESVERFLSIIKYAINNGIHLESGYKEIYKRIKDFEPRL